MSNSGETHPVLAAVLDVALVMLTMALALILPVAVYGYLSWQQFDYFRLTYFIPHEQMRATLAEPELASLLAQPLIQMNMTSGHLLANMYSLTVGQLVLSLALGLGIGLVLVAHLRLRELCALQPAGGKRAAAGAGAGVFATVAASSTGLLGCCGSGAVGGVLALAGLSSATAAQVAALSPFLQIALIAFFVAQFLWLRGRLRTLASDGDR